MASAHFKAYDKSMRRLFMQNLIDHQYEAIQAQRFRASLIVNPRTGLPLDTGAVKELPN
jgi:hypothetical protein